MRIIKKVALALFNKKKIMLVRSRKEDQVFYTLGGRIKEGESDLECLKREIYEEIRCKINSVEFLHEFLGPAHGSNDKLNIRLYKGEIIGEPKVSSEVFEIGYFDSKSDKIHLSEIARKKIFPWLKKEGYIN